MRKLGGGLGYYLYPFEIEVTKDSNVLHLSYLFSFPVTESCSEWIISLSQPGVFCMPLFIINAHDTFRGLFSGGRHGELWRTCPSHLHD